MEFPVTLKNSTFYFRTRYDDTTAGTGQLVLDPEALFTKNGFVIPTSYRSLSLFDTIEAGEPINPIPATCCVVINSMGQVHKVLCRRNPVSAELKQQSIEYICLRIPVGPHTTMVYGMDEAVVVPQLLAALAAGQEPAQAYEELAKFQNIIHPYLVMITIEDIVKRLKELNYTGSVGATRFNDFVNAYHQAQELEKKLHEKITST